METIHHYTSYHNRTQDVKSEKYPGKAKYNFLLPKNKVRAMRHIAVESDRNFSSLLNEALDLLLQKYGVTVDDETEEAGSNAHHTGN